VVAPQDIRWEPSDGAFDDAVNGRWALVLSSAEPGAPRDVWRVRVRVSPEGHPVEIGDARNLTTTPLGDDHALVVHGDHAAFATHAFGQEQSVTLLDLRGEPPQATSLADRVMAYLTNVQKTGSGHGLGRVDVTLDQPAQAAGLALGANTLAIELADEGNKRRRASLDLARGELAEGAVGMHAEPSHHLPKRFVHWAVDTARAVPWIGPEPIAWLEERVFALRDAYNQLAFKASGGGSTAEPASAAIWKPAWRSSSRRASRGRARTPACRSTAATATRRSTPRAASWSTRACSASSRARTRSKRTWSRAACSRRHEGV
jgi:hypothetical protein